MTIAHLSLRLTESGELKTKYYLNRTHSCLHSIRLLYISTALRNCRAIYCLKSHLLQRLKSSLRKFYDRYGNLTKQYDVPLSRMLHDILEDDYIQ